MSARELLLLLTLMPGLAHGAADAYRVAWRSNPATSMVVCWNQVSGATPQVHYDTLDLGSSISDYRYRQPPDRIVTYRGMTNHFTRLEILTPDSSDLLFDLSIRAK
jgi:hypothetical protein